MIRLLKGDITKIDNVDAMASTTNISSHGGGGVHSAIHRAAGPELLFEWWLQDGAGKGVFGT